MGKMAGAAKKIDRLRTTGSDQAVKISHATRNHACTLYSICESLHLSFFSNFYPEQKCKCTIFSTLFLSVCCLSKYSYDYWHYSKWVTVFLIFFFLASAI
jgi:hypothetical protein